MSRRRKPLSRQKKTALWLAGIGIAGGVGALLLWPKVRRYFGTVSNESATTKGKYHLDVQRAWDAWLTKNPDGPPFMNDDGSLNILPGYELPLSSGYWPNGVPFAMVS